jgi:deoxyribodipyrimidine photo-lyase
MSMTPALVWFRLDLRLADNAALTAAADRGLSIIPVFIFAPEEEAPWAPGAASRWWLHHSLLDLQSALSKRGAKLIIRHGPTAEALLAMAAESGAKSVFWNRRYEPAALARDRQLKTLLRKRGLAAESFPGNLLFEPGTLRNSSGNPFRVFTAFWNACQKEPAPPAPKPVPKRMQVPAKWPGSRTVVDLALEPEVDWTKGIRRRWQPGELEAMKQLRVFLKSGLEAYSVDRDRPDRIGTSRLSPHLHFGEVSARQVWHAVHSHLLRDRLDGDRRKREVYLRQIAWREFSHHLLFHFPATPRKPLRPEFLYFPWRTDAQNLAAWTQGKTGYPIVDAGMRELWHTGWMHNRVRMVVASFLVKHLLIRWQKGAAWFWNTLVDADLANNTMGWQWSAGCGADAAPYFRIFNPVLQGERFDPAGDYVRRWVPELARLPNAWIHKPWKTPASSLAGTGVELGVTYPKPTVVHDAARKRALAAFAAIKQA